jgi:hypothetical protein
LALSGIVVRSENSDPQYSAKDEMALRRFQRGTTLSYALYIYNAQLDRKTRNPQLETQVKLYFDGREIYSGDKKAFDLDGKLEDSVLLGSGYLQLGSSMNTGRYAMQYTVTDKLASEDDGTVSQWIDFEILE